MEPVELTEQIEAEAEYTLEAPVRCPACDSMMREVLVVRLLRMRVNFTSSLPRRGYALACPDCHKMITASLG